MAPATPPPAATTGGAAARLFGYDAFISFALGQPPRGTRAYASDLARKLRERGFTVFFSEDEAPVGDVLDDTLQRALRRSRILIVVANRGTLAEPRWVRKEVEEFRRRHPQRPIIPVNIGGALQDIRLGPLAEEWLQCRDRIWADEAAHADLSGVAGDEVVARLATAPSAVRSAVRLRAVLVGIGLFLAALAGVALWQRGVAVENEVQANANAALAAQQRDRALRGQSLFLSQLAEQQLKGGNAVNAMLLALEALPHSSSSPERPYVVQAEAQLYDAVSQHRELAVLGAHNKRVTFATFSADGTRLVSASHDGSARLWDVAKRAPLQVLAHAAAQAGQDAPRVTHAAFSPDGTQLVTVASDGGVASWNATDGRAVSRAREHTDAAYHVAYAPDGRRYVTAGGDGTVRLWTAGSSAPAQLLGPALDWAIASAEFSPDGRYVVAADRGEGARLWHADSGQLVATLKHPRGLYSAHFNPAGTAVLTASGDGKARLWSVPEGRLLATLSGHSDRVFQASFSPDGSRILTVSADHEARIWDARTFASIHTLQGHGHEVRHGEFSPDGRFVVTASRDDSARLWEAETGASVATLAGHAGDVTHARFSPGGDTVVTTGDTTLRLWRLRASGRVLELRHRGSVESAHFSRDGLRVLSTSGGWTEENDRTARLWSTEKGEALATITHGARVTAAAFDAGSGRVATAAEDGTVRVCDGKSGALLLELPRQETRVGAVRFSPDGERLATVSGQPFNKNHDVRLWNARTGQRLASAPGPTDMFGLHYGPQGDRLVSTGQGRITLWEAGEGLRTIKLLSGLAATFSPDGQTLAIASEPDEKTQAMRVILVDARSGAVRRELGAVPFVHHLAFSPDGRWLAAASLEHAVRLWDLASGKEARRLEGHADQVNWVAFSPDSTRLVSAAGKTEFTGNDVSFKIANSDDNGARVWDVASGQTLAILRAHGTRVRYAEFSPDGRRVVTTSDDRTARVWDLYPDTRALITRAQQLLPRRLTAAQRKEFFLE